jgi:hypothetical protein
LIQAFFLPERRERYLEFVSSPKRRRKLLAELAHFKGLDERYKYPIPPAMQTAEGITNLLRQMGASPTCLALSDLREIDGARLALTDALGTVLGRTFGTFLSCKAGSLAYFENEDGRWILLRN